MWFHIRPAFFLHKPEKVFGRTGYTDIYAGRRMKPLEILLFFIQPLFQFAC